MERTGRSSVGMGWQVGLIVTDSKRVWVVMSEPLLTLAGFEFQACDRSRFSSVPILWTDISLRPNFVSIVLFVELALSIPSSVYITSPCPSGTFERQDIESGLIN